MKNLALAGVSALALFAVGLSPAKAQGLQIAQTTISGTTCPTTTQVSVGSARPVVGTQTGGLCVQTQAPPSGTGATQVQGTAADGAAPVGNPVLEAGVYDSAPSALTTGKVGQLLLDARRRLQIVGPCAPNTAGDASTICAAVGVWSDGFGASNVALSVNSRLLVFSAAGQLETLRSIARAVTEATQGTGTLAVEETGRSFSHISSNATTTAKSGKTYLHQVCVNTKGATANTATIYNNTAASGTVVAVIDTTTAVGCLTFDAYLDTGLTVLTASGTAADLTVTYR